MDLSSIYTPSWEDQLAFLQINQKKLVLSRLICSGLLDPTKNHINSCPPPSSVSVLCDWPEMQHMYSMIGYSCQVSAQNGCQSLIASLFSSSKWLPIYFCLLTSLHMLPGSIQTWSVMLKMAAILLIPWHLAPNTSWFNSNLQNGCLCHLDCKAKASKAFVHSQMGFCIT